MTLARREALPQWLAPLSAESLVLSADAKRLLALFESKGALFYAALAAQSGLLPSQVEVGLGELCARGLITADSFAGLRALLAPAQRRPGRRRVGPAWRIESAGRWSLLREVVATPPSAEVDAARLEAQARTLLRRYGVVCRRLCERESVAPWRELARILRRLEARGELRGGHFIAGMSGEQFALPEAVEMLRRIRRTPGTGELIAVSAADPLNLLGLLLPGERLAAMPRNRLLLCDGAAIAVSEGASVRRLDGTPVRPEERAALVGGTTAALSGRARLLSQRLPR